MNTPLTTPLDDPPDDRMLAGEYVLGVLDAETRRGVQARIARDPAFAAEVSVWETHFEAWLLRVQPAQPDPHVWAGVRRRLGWSPVAAANAPRLWDNTVFWRAATGLALAAAVGAIAIALHRPLPERTTAPAVAQAPTPVPAPVESAARPVTVLASDDGHAAWIASIDADHQRMRMMPVPGPADAKGRVHELWLIPKGQAPRSLGQVSNVDAHMVDIPAADRGELVAGAILAITLEPAAGMPHAAPSGPIVAKGMIGQI